jgi:threonine/homoserine/homoserine lactone efflux protein
MIVSFLAALGMLGLLTVVPGPDVAVVTRAALSGGRRPAAQTAGGVVSGLLVWGLLAVGGLAAVLAASADAYAGLRVAGAAYLIWLGLRTLWRSRRSPISADGSSRADGPAGVPGVRGRAWRTGFVTNLMNPKIGVFYTSALPALVPAGAPTTATQAGLVLVHVGLSAIWLNAWARVLSGSRSVLRRPGAVRAGERVGGAVLVGFGVEIAARTV